MFADPSSPPDLSNYDVVGFDLDHTLVRYRMRTTHTYLFDCFARGLLESCEGYPQEVREPPTEELLQLGLNTGVYDYKREVVLKLGKGNKVLRAYRGSTPLTREEI